MSRLHRPLSTASQRRAASLVWGVRLRSPAAVALMLVLVLILLWAVMPVFAVNVRAWLPKPIPTAPRVTAATPAAAIRPKTVAAPPVTVAAPTPAPAVPGPLTAPVVTGAAAAPAPINLPCHVRRNGGAVIGKPEWAIEVVLDENAVDGAGRTVIPAGTAINGTVRLGRDGDPVAWPTAWRLSLPEDGGGVRELEVTAFYRSLLGGIGNGATGQLCMSAINRIGDHRGDGGSLAAAPDPDQPPVSVLTGQAPGASDDLPRH